MVTTSLLWVSSQSLRGREVEGLKVRRLEGREI